MDEKTAIILGCTGLVGSELLDKLLALDIYKNIIVLIRREISLDHPKLIKKIVNFEKLEDELKDIEADDIFCCIGTTLKKAKTKEAFKSVDFDIPTRFALQLKNPSTKRFILISSIGANPKAKGYYLKIKGELEEKLSSIGFKSLIIFRPSLLDGNRKEFRFAENLGLKLARMIPKWKSLTVLRPTKVSDLVTKMIETVKSDEYPSILVVKHEKII